MNSPLFLEQMEYPNSGILGPTKKEESSSDVIIHKPSRHQTTQCE